MTPLMKKDKLMSHFVTIVAGGMKKSQIKRQKKCTKAILKIFYNLFTEVIFGVLTK